MKSFKIKRYKLFTLTFILALSIFTTAKVLSQNLPVFEIQLTNGKSFRSKNLSRNKPLILIYFAPDCGHCQVLMDSVFKNIEKFKGAQLVMVTFKPLNELADFENHYKTKLYSNIKAGTEAPLFFFRNYYQLDNTPFTALYDKRGALIISYKKQTPVNELIKQLKKLK